LVFVNHLASLLGQVGYSLSFINRELEPASTLKNFFTLEWEWKILFSSTVPFSNAL
jgi:hypothetical protein